MTNEELKEALLNKKPVFAITNDNTILHCECVSGITYREKNGHISIHAEVLDRNGRTVYSCDPKKIRYEV